MINVLVTGASVVFCNIPPVHKHVLLVLSGLGGQLLQIQHKCVIIERF